MVKILGVIVSVIAFETVDGPVTYGMFEPPIIFLITAYVMELDLTWSELVGLEIKHDID